MTVTCFHFLNLSLAIKFYDFKFMEILIHFHHFSVADCCNSVMYRHIVKYKIISIQTAEIKV